MRRITTIAITFAAASLMLLGGPSAQAGGGCHSDKFSDEANTHVELSKNCFEPTVVRVQPGDTVTWSNTDPDAHAVSGAANTWGTDDEVLPGKSVTYQFDEAGVFPYFCYLHPSMVGAVVVGDGTAASADTTGSGGVKAVSAQAPGAEADEQSEAITETDDRNATWPLVIGVGVLAASAGFAGALVVRRRSFGGE